MQKVEAERELQTLTELHYRYPAETVKDVRHLQRVYTDLRLYTDSYCFPNGEKKQLVNVSGTVPVQYDGGVYNIPVCVWLHVSHPASRPRCYVVPSAALVINTACGCVRGSGEIRLDGLDNWRPGVSSLTQLVSEMRGAFQKDTPLYARFPQQATPPSAVVQAQPISAGRQVRRSYTEELLGIDFSPSPSNHYNPFIDPLSSTMEALKLNGDSNRDTWGDSPANSPVHIGQSRTTQQTPPPVRTLATHTQPAARDKQTRLSGLEHIQTAAGLTAQQAAIFESVMSLKGRSFSADDVIEAVRLNRDFQSALKYLSHTCPICQETVSFSKIIPMTHCSCFLCQSCFTSCFVSAIKEKSVDQLSCPQCHRPEVRGHTAETMEYFNLLDTQIRHFLPAEVHELFQRKLRDRALQEIDSFRWCSHCSFGMLHEADRLRMDCPSCKKSTCCQCRSPWAPEHERLSCEEFRALQQRNHPEQLHPNYCRIECPKCASVFSLSKGGCLHFTCSQCQHQFCGGCSMAFTPGSACSFRSDCGTKGLHAHHPRDCLYHLRDWSVARLTSLLKYYRVSPSCVDPPRGSTPGGSSSSSGETGPICLVPELRDDRGEEPCGRPAHPEHRGYCTLHYKECLVELVNGCRGDPAMLFSEAEMKAELKRWSVAVPTRNPAEPELIYRHRLHTILTSQVPLRRSTRSSSVSDVCPKSSFLSAGAPRLLL